MYKYCLQEYINEPIYFEASNLCGKLQEQCGYTPIPWKSVCPPRNIIRQWEDKSEVFESPESEAYLVHIKFHIDDRHSLISITVVLYDPIHGFWNIFHHQIQKKFICTCSWKETMLQRDNIWMIHHTHQLQFTILISSVL